MIALHINVASFGQRFFVLGSKFLPNTDHLGEISTYLCIRRIARGSFTQSSIVAIEADDPRPYRWLGGSCFGGKTFFQRHNSHGSCKQRGHWLPHGNAQLPELIEQKGQLTLIMAIVVQRLAAHRTQSGSSAAVSDAVRRERLSFAVALYPAQPEKVCTVSPAMMTATGSKNCWVYIPSIRGVVTDLAASRKDDRNFQLPVDSSTIF